MRASCYGARVYFASLGFRKSCKLLVTPATSFASSCRSLSLSNTTASQASGSLERPLLRSVSRRPQSFSAASKRSRTSSLDSCSNWEAFFFVFGVCFFINGWQNMSKHLIPKKVVNISQNREDTIMPEIGLIIERPSNLYHDM